MEINQQEESIKAQVEESSRAQSIKLSKNTKGYNWDIRVVLQDGETMAQAVERLQQANEMMVARYRYSS